MVWWAWRTSVIIHKLILQHLAHRDDADFYSLQRSYLDAGVWLGDWGKKDPLFWFPKDGPVSGQIFIDFTHGIDLEGSANYGLWTARLDSIASRFGKDGKDNVWCAPTGRILDYVTARGQAKVSVNGGRLAVELPDSVPGSQLTLKVKAGPQTIGVAFLATRSV